MVGSDGLLSQVESQTIEVGDVVRLEEDDVVPADLVVLSTTHQHGQGGYSMGFQRRIYQLALVPSLPKNGI